ncbi:hypothetical protein CCB80_14100 [Armatimonadetes bacterium Uphvl-Ar1]|nr:hypothetical protein CCB80_14100 [Armatimonadetes bacterium Uphvl-Ar1]
MKILKTTKWTWWVTASILLSTVASLIAIYPRYEAEWSNRAVGLAVEADVVSDLAASQGLTLAEGLAQLKDAGVNVLSVNERTAGELLSNGVLALKPVANGSYRLLGNQTDQELVRRAFEVRYGASNTAGNEVLYTDPTRLRSLTIGLSPNDVIAAQSSGLPILARVGNPTGTNHRYVIETIRALARDGVKYLLPLGDQALGNPSLLVQTGDALKVNKIAYTTAEFSKTVGDSVMGSKFPENTIRLHAAQAAELVRMSKPAIIERYSKAARERNIRILLVRPAITASDSPLDDFADLVKGIRNQIQIDGLTVKEPRSFVAPVPIQAAQWMIGIFLLPALFFGISKSFMLLRLKSPELIGLLGALGIAGGIFIPSLREISALAITILLPVIGALWYLENPQRPVASSFLGFSAISLAGGLPVAGLLVGLPYMLGQNIFTGVKVSVFLPIFIVGVLLLGQVFQLKTVMKQPIVWGSALLTIFSIGVLGFMYLRTGNDNPAAVSGLELQFRDILDRVLGVRPRTKEFMIGHPAMIVGMALFSLGASKDRLKIAGAGLIVVGMIGQTSIVNTLCHLHTPIHLNLLRIGIGILFGCILGGLGWLIVGKSLKQSTGEEN